MPKFCRLYSVRMSSDEHYFFHPRHGVMWLSYILNVPWDALVMDGDQEEDIFDIRVRDAHYWCFTKKMT
ncbi:hypothetical protein DVH24_027778 [Malus domestica]|uniref:Uncharacterized protein n=1 Tax=Malus domestica TaxID=3750 RepID=A0A498HET4_MALDO|nr:hypothetical protein DVH24_027778 [Malus domestica]